MKMSPERAVPWQIIYSFNYTAFFCFFLSIWRTACAYKGGMVIPWNDNTSEMGKSVPVSRNPNCNRALRSIQPYEVEAVGILKNSYFCLLIVPSDFCSIPFFARVFLFLHFVLLCLPPPLQSSSCIFSAKLRKGLTWLFVFFLCLRNLISKIGGI